jgi:protein SCO1
LSPTVRRGLIAFVAALIVIVGAFAYEQFYAEPGDTEQAAVAVGGPFSLTDQNGAVKHDSDFHGKLMLIYFGYTYCPDVCPTTLNTMSQALARLGPQAAGIVPIFITIDPARDTPAQMKLYASNFDPRFVALTGPPEEIDAVAREYRVYYKKAEGEAGGAYTVDHSSVIYLMGRDGRYIGHFDPGISADSMADKLKKFL